MAEAIISGEATAVDSGAAAAEESVVDDAALETQDTGSAEEQVGDEGDQSTEDAVDATQEVAASGPEKVKALVESLKKTDPALAKEIKNLFFAAEALKKEIPGGLPEIRQLKATVEELGGKEGIEAIRAQQAEWDGIDQKFANGDPTVFDYLIQNNPEGFVKLVPAALDKLASVDRETYNHALAGIFVSTLDSWRFTDSVERIVENLSRIVDDKGQQLCANDIKRLDAMAKQYESLREVASKVPQKKADSETKKLESERAEIAQQRAQVATDYVATSTQRYAEKKYSEFIPVEARNRKFDVEKLKSINYGEDQGTAYDRFTREIDSEVAQLIRQDAAHVKKVKDAITAGRKEDAAKLSNAKFDSVYQTAVRRVVGRWATTFNPRGVSSKSTTTNAGKPVVEAGVKKLSEAPDTNLIDKSDPNWRENYLMHSKAKLKTGQRVAW